MWDYGRLWETMVIFGVDDDRGGFAPELGWF